MRDYETKTRGHVWQTYDGDPKAGVDIFGYCWEDHNGPRCVKCGYGFCHHCQDGPTRDCQSSNNLDNDLF